MTSLTIATILATLLSLHGYRRKSLTGEGAVAAWLVGFTSLACGNRGFLLLLFYLVSSSPLIVLMMD
jgi:uncharacterized membrane protein